MHQVLPFCGYRFDPDRVGSLQKVVTQPYDKITSEMLREYLESSPYNIARVIKNTDYAEAGRNLHDWIASGILKRDARESFYPYEQIFDWDHQTFSRLGFIGLISLQDTELAVKGHENILKAPLEDRLNLIRETRSNEGLIFSLYSDDSLSADRLLRACIDSQSPIAEVTDEVGARHRLWQLSDLESQRRLSKALQSSPLYIADGHHRFETSLLFMKECLENGVETAPVDFDKRMMAFFNMEAPGLRILPTHRALRNLPGFELEPFLNELGSAFRVTPRFDLAALDQGLRGPGLRIGLITADPFQIFLLEDRGDQPDLLDVNVLHHDILEPLLRIGASELASQSHVDYYRDRNNLVDKVRAGVYQLAFILNPTTLEQVRRVSEQGQKMPQKSTDFYPKLLTGLVLMKMQDRAGAERKSDD